MDNQYFQINKQSVDYESLCLLLSEVAACIVIFSICINTESFKILFINVQLHISGGTTPRNTRQILFSTRT
jgi:hypothetical protein